MKMAKRQKVEGAKPEAQADAVAEVAAQETPNPAAAAATEAPAPAPAGTAGPQLPAGWQERVGAFAEKVGVSVEEANSALRQLLGEPSAAALEALADPAAATDEDIISCFAGRPRAIVRKSIALLRGPRQETVPQAESTGPSLDVLPYVPDDESFIAALKVGGELKVNKDHVTAAVKAGLASKTRLFDLPSTLLERMEEWAESQDEPCGEAFFDLQRMITERRYAEVLAAINVDGRLISEKRKSAFLTRLDERLWDSLVGFHRQLVAWQQSWNEGMANPAAMMAGIAAMMSGSGVMPPGMMQPPPTDTLRDAAEGVIDKINNVFAGLGVPVARALAYDASRIKAVIMNPQLPAMVGATTRDQMLKMLGVNVTADYVRLERNIARYTLAIMEYKNVPSGNSELAYLAAMFTLGHSIPWDQLTSSPSPSPKRSPFMEADHKTY